MKPYYEAQGVTIYHGDCREVLDELDAQFTACVTDPPYGLGTEPDPAKVMRAWADGMDPDVGGGGFMGKEWDRFVPSPAVWQAVYESLLPGAPLFCFAGTRTSDWMGMSLRFAGFERRDTVMWLTGQGFPKSHSISKAIDDAKGAEREVVGQKQRAGGMHRNEQYGWKDTDGNEDKSAAITSPATDEAERWDGYGTALAPGHEPIILAMKPRDGTFAENALRHRVAGLNIDAARIETDEDISTTQGQSQHQQNGEMYSGEDQRDQRVFQGHDKGRWPANVVLDERASVLLDRQSGVRDVPGTYEGHVQGQHGTCYSPDPSKYGDGVIRHGYGDTGGASRFFYTSKASKSDRTKGMPPGAENPWPTVKPTDLIGWLCKLASYPERNHILDPLAGSGTLAYVATQLGVKATLIDQSEEACELCALRLQGQQNLFASQPDS